MKFKTFVMILASASLIAAALPGDSDARGGGRSGGQGGQGPGLQTQSMEQNRVREQNRYQQGKQAQSKSAQQKKGNTYGPGDGTGNKGDRPLDGTGYGAPANR